MAVEKSKDSTSNSLETKNWLLNFPSKATHTRRYVMPVAKRMKPFLTLDNDRRT